MPSLYSHFWFPWCWPPLTIHTLSLYCNAPYIILHVYIVSRDHKIPEKMMCIWDWLHWFNIITFCNNCFHENHSIVLYGGKICCVCLCHFPYPFLYCWTPSLVLKLGYCEWCSGERGRAGGSLTHWLGISWGNVQECCIQLSLLECLRPVLVCFPSSSISWTSKDWLS